MSQTIYKEHLPKELEKDEIKDDETKDNEPGYKQHEEIFWSIAFDGCLEGVECIVFPSWTMGSTKDTNNNWFTVMYDEKYRPKEELIKIIQNKYTFNNYSCNLELIDFNWETPILHYKDLCIQTKPNSFTRIKDNTDLGNYYWCVFKFGCNGCDNCLIDKNKNPALFTSFGRL
jgi:hypothetical protein